MSNNDESFLSGNPIMEVMEVRAYQAGLTCFENFIPVALNSNVPVTTRDAIFAQITDLQPDILRDSARGDLEGIELYSKELAFRLFEKEFSTSQESHYAIDYANAVALYKSWQDVVRENSQAFSARMELGSTFVNLFGVDLDPNPSAALAQLESLNLEGHDIVDKMKLFLRSSISDSRAIDRMKRIAITQCGQMSLSEQRLNELNGNVLRRTVSALVGNASASPVEINAYIERYFEDPRKVGRMRILGQGKRI
jgi:hypothetical protein